MVEQIATARNMPILYSLVSRESCALAEFMPVNGNFQQVTKLILRKLPKTDDEGYTSIFERRVSFLHTHAPIALHVLIRCYDHQAWLQNLDVNSYFIEQQQSRAAHCQASEVRSSAENFGKAGDRVSA